jgi:uncharacterized protein
MRLVIAGGTGFLGRALTTTLAADGHVVVCLSRSGGAAPKPGAIWARSGISTVHWRGDEETEGWGHVIDGADVVVNLAGESIAARRWTAKQKNRLRDSRLLTARAMGRAIRDAGRPPALFVSASAVGIYGDRGDEPLDEEAQPGTDFLANLAVAWEQAAVEAGGSRVPVVRLRTGLVLARDGGALAKMLPPFRAGLGGPLGRGTQYMPWIHIDDWVALVRWIVERRADGVFNLTAPEPVTNAEFAKALGRALGRPALLPAPAFALRLLLGEMADALLLSGQRARPTRALGLGFAFRYPTIDAALGALFRR